MKALCSICRCRVSRIDLSRVRRYLRPRAKPKRLSKVKGGEEIKMDRVFAITQVFSLRAARTFHLLLRIPRTLIVSARQSKTPTDSMCFVRLKDDKEDEKVNNSKIHIS